MTAASEKMYVAVLPRITDLVSDLLTLTSHRLAGEAVEAMVRDAEDAFWQIPLHASEHRFYCALLRMPDGRTRYLAYNRTAQGSRARRSVGPSSLA